MNRRDIISVLVAATVSVAAMPALAASFSDDVVAQLTKQGFSNIQTTTTWLGRVVIDADRGGGHREIILNPRTGEILRDIWTAAGGKSGAPILDDVADSGGAGQGGGDGGDGGGSSSGDGSSGSGSGGDDHGGSGNGGSGHSGDGGGDGGNDN